MQVPRQQSDLINSQLISIYLIIHQKSIKSFHLFSKALMQQQHNNQPKLKPKGKQTHNKYTVAVRIRPSLSNTNDYIFTVHDGRKIKQLRPKSIVTYSFDQAFEPQHNNQHIYQNSVKTKIDYFIKNKVNTTILAYGQTGSGKTHTLFGHQNKNSSASQNGSNVKQKGLCQYILTQITNQLLPLKQQMYCSFMQIYKQKVTDLLSGNQISLRQNKQNQLIMPQRTLIKIQSLEQILQTLKKANSNKIFGHSYVHSQSSRSHVMFMLQLKNGSCLNIVDLCGCQVLTYKFDQKQRQETNAINLSLFTLNAVINDLCDQNKDKNKFIPFRNSVLTRLLKKSLIDQKKTQIYLFCNIAPEEQHRTFSVSTLKFGQTAISIDQAENMVQQKINLSQQKRDSKKVENIIDFSPKPNQNQQKRLKWSVYESKIWNDKVIVYKRLQQQQCQTNILFLHAYGYGCSGYDWDYFIPYISSNCKANLFSVDFPGFGQSQGKKFTSRAQDFGNKGQPIQFMIQLFKIFKISPKNKVFLIGYDLGGAIALSCGLNNNLKKCINGIIAFHPTWTDKLQKLALITTPVQLLWFPIQNFHLISAGQKMSKIIKSSKLYRMNVGAYTQQKAAGYYDLYSDTIGQLMAQFITNICPIPVQQQYGRRGRIQQQIINIGTTKQQQQLQIQRNAIKQYYQLLNNKNYQIVFDSIIKGGQSKPKYVRLATQLPTIQPGIKIERLVNLGIFKNGPMSSLNLKQEQDFPLFPIDRQVHVQTNINLSVLSGQKYYLTYDKNGQCGITHRCYITDSQKQQQILDSGEIEVRILGKDQQYHNIKVDLHRTIQLNTQTLFRYVNGNLILEDNVTCKYSSLVTKLMLVRCCHAIRDIVPLINLGSNTEQILQMQKQCAKLIYQQMDLRHLVHEGIDNTRFTGIDVGKLAYFGQGNCHHLASVLAALLLPFSKILGWEVIFRAGSFFMTGRDIDQNGNPRQGWSGKPNTKVQDHTWLQILYKPSFQVFVMDPSFGICSEPIDKIYTFKGKMHISGKNQCSSNIPVFTKNIYNDQYYVKNSKK